jgi:hypothetical protein
MWPPDSTIGRHLDRRYRLSAAYRSSKSAAARAGGRVGFKSRQKKSMREGELRPTWGAVTAIIAHCALFAQDLGPFGTLTALSRSYLQSWQPSFLAAARATRTDPSGSPAAAGDGRGLRRDGRIPGNRPLGLRDRRRHPERRRAGPGMRQAGGIRSLFRALTWCCVVTLAILSADEMVRSGWGGRVEHFAAYAGSAGIAMIGYGQRSRPPLLQPDAFHSLLQR